MDIIQQFDRGIQSRLISEQLATVVNTVSIVKRNPFPSLVNSIVVRLSEHFVTGSNSLRGVISRCLGQMDEQLLLVFSHNEVCRRLLIVSHSNDPLARAHTLNALASVASIAKENKEVHTLVVESLSSSHKQEFNGACNAVAAFCRLSTDFTRTVLTQLSEYLLSSTTHIERKIQIVSIFSRIQSDRESTQTIFALGARLFDLNTDMTFHSTLLSALTSLAILTRFSILDQLSLLLSILSSTIDSSPVLSAVVLYNISRLANHSHVWTKEHIARLGEYRHRVHNDENVCCGLLKTLGILARRRHPSHMEVLTEVLSEMSPLYTHQSMRIRAEFIQFSVHVFVSSPSDLHRQNLLSCISTTLSSPLPNKIGVRVSRVAGVFLTNDSVRENEGVTLVQSLCKLPITHPNAPLFLQLFCHLSQMRKAFIHFTSQWANTAIQCECSLSSSHLSFLAYPPFTADEVIDVNVFKGLPYTTLYEIVRVGFRNGHWRSLSLPLLRSMGKLSLSLGMHEWLISLTQLALSQPRKCSVSDMRESLSCVSKAKKGLMKLSRSTLNPLQSFCYRYVEALEKTRLAQMHLLSSVSVFISHPSPDGSPSPVRPPSYRTPLILHSCLALLDDCISCWSLLLRRSFDGDSHSIDIISNEHFAMSLIAYGVRCLIGKTTPLCPTLLTASSDSVIMSESRSLLLWAASSLQQLGGRKEITQQSMDHFYSVFSQLYTRWIFIPRLFFQPVRRTTIKLSISPGAEGELTVSPTIPVPIRVDGVISTSGKMRIDTVIVSANIHFYSNKEKDRVEVRRVDIHDGNFFTAQFLLKFNDSAQMDISVEIVDGEKRKTWLSDASAILRVDVNM